MVPSLSVLALVNVTSRSVTEKVKSATGEARVTGTVLTALSVEPSLSVTVSVTS